MSEVTIADLVGPLLHAANRAVLLGGDVQVLRFSGEDSPVGVLAMLGTENANDEPSATYEERRGRCYELAGYAIAFGEARFVPGARLVHGSWHGPGAKQRIGHAWLEIPTPAGPLFWEPITATLFDHEVFAKWSRAWDERTYDMVTARRLCLANKNFGRWHDSRYP